MSTLPTQRPFTAGQCAALACLLEAAAPKPGNVHPAADFEDMTYFDLAASAVAILPVMDEAERGVPLGDTVLKAVNATQEAVKKNTNLGIILLLTPLAMVSRDKPLREGVAEVLTRTTSEDAKLVYSAIREAQPGGLGRVAEDDVADAPPADLIAAMGLAADRDLIARQYTNGFAEVFDVIAPKLRHGLDHGWSLPGTIVHAQMELLSEYPDSLIARKCGDAVARESADRAAAVLAAGQPGEPAYRQALADLDSWLRRDGHRRNPGTTADLIAAGLFALLREGVLQEVTR